MLNSLVYFVPPVYSAKILDESEMLAQGV